MSMRFTAVVREILYFIDQYGFITTKQCANLFYKGRKRAELQAGVKLNLLLDNKVLIRWKHPYTAEYIYQKQKSNVSDHYKYVLDLYSELNKLVDKVLYFKIEEPWMGNKRRNDGHIVFIKDEKLSAFLIEFEKHSTTSTAKINEIYDSEEVQKWYKDNYGQEFFPSVLLITPSGTSKCRSSDGKWESIPINYRFEGLEDIL